MSYNFLEITGNVLCITGLAGIILAPLAASIALDFLILSSLKDKNRDDSFITGMLFGMFISRERPIAYFGDSPFEIGLTITFSAIATGIAAICCAVLGNPGIASIIAIAWAGCLGLYMLGEGLKNLSIDEPIHIAQACVI